MVSLKMIVRLGLLWVFLVVGPAVMQAQYTCTTNSGQITIAKYTGPGGAVTLTNTIDGYPVTRIGNGAFSNCFTLSSIATPNCLTNVGTFAFSRCTNLMEVYFQGNVTNLGNGAFSNCTSLTTVYFQGNRPTLGTNVFSGDNNANVYYLPSTTGWGATFGGRPTVPVGYAFITNSGTTTITGYSGSGGAVIIPNTISNLQVSSIGDYAFECARRSWRVQAG